MGLTRTRTEVVVPDGATEHAITRGITLRAIMAPHDAMGSALLRIDIPTPQAPASLGYATDLGAIPEHAPEFLAGVDILALESNYDPHLQQSSGRHPMLVDRVMGGAGHLSNDESAQLARAVEPKDQLVLLHLSRQCNTPHLAESAHAHGVACPVTPAAHDRVTGPYTLVGASVPASTAQTTS
jgi:hypothetical protein